MLFAVPVLSLLLAGVLTLLLIAHPGGAPSPALNLQPPTLNSP
jgi:hypothetical protein